LNDYGSKKSRKREAAALALISCQTVIEAATAAGISQTTLYRWRQEPEFQQIVTRVKSEALTTASNNLAAISSKAVKALTDVMDKDTTPEAQKVSAAKALLEMAFKLREQDEIITRLNTLEKAFDNKGGDYNE